MDRWTARPATSQRYQLGEGPVWDADAGLLRWVDIAAGEVLAGHLEGERVQPDEQRRLDSTVGALAPGRHGRSIVAGHHDLLLVDPGGTIVARTPVIEPGRASRLNDGACDPAGRFLVGTMSLDGRVGQERLVRLDGAGPVVIDDDLTLSNGLAWSPDGTVMYSIDSIPGVLWARDYLPATGRCGARRPLIRFDDATPDGLAVDATGHLWIAMWGAGEVRRCTPAGRQVGVVDVPVANPTSVAFIGAALEVMVITTAGEDDDADGPTTSADAGRLFLVEPGVRGVAASRWNGRWPGEGRGQDRASGASAG